MSDEKLTKLKGIASEVVPEDEFREMVEDSSEYTAYVGYEPSGVLHLGHMVTANAMIQLQEMGFNVKILIADLHAELNDKGSAEEMKETGEKMIQQLKSFGLDEDTEFIFGSDFQMNEEYQKMMHRISKSATSRRAERSMADISHGESTKVSHLMYPVMQATDIWWLDADVALGGMEQRKVHMLARDVFPKNDLEKPSFVHTPLIADLSTGDGKMSSSSGVSVSSADSREEVSDKINSAYCPAEPEDDTDNPVLQIYNYHIFPRYDSVKVERDEEYGGDLEYDTYDELETALHSGDLHPLDAKEALSKYLNRLLDPIRGVHD